MPRLQVMLLSGQRLRLPYHSIDKGMRLRGQRQMPLAPALNQLLLLYMYPHSTVHQHFQRGG